MDDGLRQLQCSIRIQRSEYCSPTSRHPDDCPGYERPGQAAGAASGEAQGDKKKENEYAKNK